MASYYNSEINISGDGVIANKKQFATSDNFYKHIYIGQILEMLKLVVAFLFSHLILRLLDNTILKYFINNTLLYAILIICMALAILLLAGSIFTYIKIVDEKDELLDKLLK